MLFAKTFGLPVDITGAECGALPCPATGSPIRAVGRLLVKTLLDPLTIVDPAMSALALDTPGISGWS